MADQSMTDRDLSDLLADMFPVQELPGGGLDLSIADGQQLLGQKLHELLGAGGTWAHGLVDGLSERPTGSCAQVQPDAVYRLTAEHYRFHSKWDGVSHSVRVRLPETRRADEVGLEVVEHSTGWYGDILGKDHFALSSAELLDAWRAKFNETPPNITHVDLVTGVRRPMHAQGREAVLGRFSPLSVFLAYDGKVPRFYALESGNFWGQSGKLHIAKDMKEGISESNDFAPTWFSDKSHIYHGRLEMRASHPRESEVWVSVKEKVAHHFRAHVLFDQLTAAVPQPGKWIGLESLFRFEALFNQLRAIGRQAVISQAGHPIRPNSNSLREPLLSTVAAVARWSAMLKWKSKPPATPGFIQSSAAANESAPQDE
jgi:hypothetical protein